MTPELKTACELVFQEHKLSDHPIKWNREPFRGRISIGLCEMAKETLVKKNIILSPVKSKKIFTQLNPDVAAADNFEEAEKMIENKVTAIVHEQDYNAEEYLTNHVNGFSVSPPAVHIQTSSPSVHVFHATHPQAKWWMKPVYLYVVWPLCGAVGGALLSYLLNFIFSTLFFHNK